jgi:ribonuclease Z
MGTLARILAVAIIALAPAVAHAQALRVTLLGTGTPEPIVDRFGPSTLVEAGPEKLLFDVGRGASQRLWQLGIPLSGVTGVFITHLHSDHVVGLPDVWLTGWTAPAYGRRGAPLRVWGPAGTREMMSHLEQAFAGDIRIRLEDEKLPARGVAVDAQDITEGVVYQNNGVKVTVFNVDHGYAIRPAFGYRVDYGGRSVVIAGDTRYTDNLLTFARGTDLLIYPMALTSPDSPMAPTVKLHFTTPEDSGRVFDQVKPKLAVYNHIILLGNPPPTVQDIVTRTRSTYKGPLEVGEDLMRFEIGDEVAVTGR